MQIEETKKEVDNASKVVANFQRIVPKQWDHIRFNSRFVPLRKELKGGVMMVVDNNTNEAVEYVAISQETSKPEASKTNEPAAPKPFVFDEK